jgi:hypothetical protein
VILVRYSSASTEQSLCLLLIEDTKYDLYSRLINPHIKYVFRKTGCNKITRGEMNYKRRDPMENPNSRRALFDN